jgi:trans-aconitate methyltransferase
MRSEIQRVDHYSNEQIQAQWDRVALPRNMQLRSGKDVSFELVLKPTILNLIQDSDCSSVLDAGCGSGVLTEVLATKAKEITGVDMSAVSISIANNSNTCPKNVQYVASTIEDYLTKTNDRYSLIVANMVLQDSADITACLKALASRCDNQSLLVATITHPWFWPTYWGYDKEPWFKYSEEQAIEAPFKISNDVTPIGITTHFHRPLSLYVEKLSEAGFQIDMISEPMPPLIVQKQYPSVWQFPRFLAIRCKYKPHLG